MNRRDLLVALLGAGFVGCSPTRRDLPPGELVGADVALGHRLRERHTLRPQRWETLPLVLVGAGVAGLSAGWQLRRAGWDRWVLLELEADLGGTARAGAGPIPHPWGAHYLPAPRQENVALLELLGEMGVVEGTDAATGEPVYAEHVLCRDPHERLFAHGHWQEGLWLAQGANPDDEAQRRRFFGEIDRWVSWRDGRGRRAFCLPSRRGSDDREVLELDRVSMADWMNEHMFTSSRLRWLVDYACRDDYGATPDSVSAWAGLFYFAARRAEPGQESQPVLTWPEGNGRLVAHLAHRLPIETGWAVAEIIPHEHTVDVVALNARGEVRGWHAQQVIFAAPRFVAESIVRGYPGPRHAFTYGAWMVANLHLRERPREPGFPLCWDNVLYSSPSLGYVVATHQMGVDHGPTVWTYYYPLCDRDPLAARRKLYQFGRDEWAEVALADLERAHPELRSLVRRIDVIRWGHAMIRPEVGFFRQRPQIPVAYRGVTFAHSDSSGLPLFEEAFEAGRSAALSVLASLRRS